MASTATDSKAKPSSSAGRFVPIRPSPAFRPLLPKPSTTTAAAAATTATTPPSQASASASSANANANAKKPSNIPKTSIQCASQLKVERRKSDEGSEKKPKKKATERKTKKRTQSQPAAQTLPNTISPASLVYKNTKKSTSTKPKAAKATMTATTSSSSSSSSSPSSSSPSSSPDASSTSTNTTQKDQQKSAISTLLSQNSHNLNTDVKVASIMQSALRPSKSSSKVMLSMGASLEQQQSMATAFDLNTSDLYLMNGPTSPSSVVDSSSLLWGETERDLIQLGGRNGTDQELSPELSSSENSPIDSLNLLDNSIESAVTDFTMSTGYSESLLTLDSYLTPEPDDNLEIRDSFSFLGTAVNS